MRIRQSSYQYPKTLSRVFKQWTNTATPTTNITANPVYQTVTETNWMEDVVTPGFRRIVAKGGIVNNPMHRVVTLEKYAGGAYDAEFLQYASWNPSLLTGWTTHGEYLDNIYNVVNRYKPVDGPDVSALQSRAITAAAAKANECEMQIWATVGEMDKTITSLCAIFSRVIGIFRAVKRLDAKKLAREISPSELSKRYMELRYAIRPLVYDATNALNALSKDKTAKRVTSRATVSDSTTGSDVVSAFQNQWAKADFSRTTQVSTVAKSGFLYQMQTLTQMNVWGVDQLMTSAWELTPMSFILDWFLNIGKVIQSWQPTTGMTGLASWITVETTTVQSSSLVNCVPLWPSTYIHSKYFSASMSCYKMTIDKSRAPNPTLPVLPRFDVNLDVLKLLDLGLILKSLT